MCDAVEVSPIYKAQSLNRKFVRSDPKPLLVSDLVNELLFSVSTHECLRLPLLELGVVRKAYEYLAGSWMLWSEDSLSSRTTGYRFATDSANTETMSTMSFSGIAEEVINSVPFGGEQKSALPVTRVLSKMPVIDTLHNLASISHESFFLRGDGMNTNEGKSVCSLLMSVLRGCDESDLEAKCLAILARMGSDQESSEGSSGHYPWALLVETRNLDLIYDLITLKIPPRTGWRFGETFLNNSKCAAAAALRRIMQTVPSQQPLLKRLDETKQIVAMCRERNLLTELEHLMQISLQVCYCVAELVSWPQINFSSISKTFSSTLLTLLEATGEENTWKKRPAICIVSTAVQQLSDSLTIEIRSIATAAAAASAAASADGVSDTALDRSERRDHKLLQYVKRSAVSTILERAIDEYLAELRLLDRQSALHSSRVGIVSLDSLFLPLPEPGLSALLVETLIAFTIFFDNSIAIGGEPSSSPASFGDTDRTLNMSSRLTLDLSETLAVCATGKHRP